MIIQPPSLADNLLREEARKRMIALRPKSMGPDEDLKEKALGDPFTFSRDILGYRKLLPRLHGVWSEKIKPHFQTGQPDGWNALFQAFRGSYKSSFLSISLPLWLLAKNPNLRILVANESDANATDFVKAQESHILYNRVFMAYFGEWYRKDEFRDADYVIKDRTSLIGKESSVTAAGMGSALTGGHYDVIIADDLAGPEDRDSLAKRKRTEKFYQDMFSLLNKGGSMIVVGTRWHKDDIYNHIVNVQNPELEREGQKPFECFFHPASDGEERASFPEIMDERELLDKRIKVGVVQYSAQYKLSPRSIEDMVFKNLHYFDPTQVKVNGKMRRIGYADYAGGKPSTANDFSAIIDLLQEEDGTLLVWEAEIKKRPVSETNARIIQKHQHTPYSQFGVEDDIYEMISNDLNRQSKEQKAYININARAMGDLPNKVARINSMEGLVSFGTIKFRSDWRTAPGNYYLLIEQLEAFGVMKEHDDGPDALEGAVSMARINDNAWGRAELGESVVAGLKGY